MEPRWNQSYNGRSQFSPSFHSTQPVDFALTNTLQLPHRPIASIPRGGANTSDHVDILGSTGLNEIILKVATGAGDEVEENFVSNIREYAQKIRWD